jgi:hypothetical protein
MRMGPKLEPRERTACSPGPGAYGDVCAKRNAPRSKALKRNGFGSASRKSFSDEAAKCNASPGPGGYFPPVEWPRGKPSQNCSFGAAARKSMAMKSASTVPGPGAYAMKSTLSGPKWTTTTKEVAVLETDGDGPAMYSLPSTLQQRRFSLAGKPSNSQEKGSYDAAPGSYDLAQNLAQGGKRSTSRAPKFGSATRGPSEDAQQFDYPGPGWYRPKDCVKERIPEASMGKGPRAVGEGSKATGVGSARPWYLDGPCSALGVPGPESYETSTGLEGPMISISEKLDDAAVRGFVKKDKVPGPGAYDPSFSGGETEAHQTSMGNLARSVNVDDADVRGEGPARPWYLEASYCHPGPGTYRPERYDKNNVGSEGPIGPRFGASMKARVRPCPPADETPGPGAHGPAATCIGC